MLELPFTIQACILMCSFITTTLSFDYCSISCKFEDVVIKQIICERNYKCSLPAYGCINFQNATLSPEEKVAVLEKHNRLRNTVALGETNFALKHITAADMNELLWDTELETIALCWVNTCGMYENDINSVCLDTEHAESGYNVAFKRISVPSHELKSIQTLEEHINGWFSEAEGFSEESVDYYPSDHFQRKLKRFSQLAWAETTHVGCARSVYGQYITMFACVYSPAGNIDDKTVFIKGPPCSRCKYGTCSKKYEGLCTVTKPRARKSTTTTTTPSTAASTSIITITNPSRITTRTTTTTATTRVILKQRAKQRRKKEKKKVIRHTSRKPKPTLTTKTVMLRNYSTVTVAKRVHPTKIEIPGVFINPFKNRTIMNVLESRHAAQPVRANKVCRHDKTFVKDFGLFIVGMVIIFK